MNAIDRAAGSLLIGFILFISCFCAGWWLGLLPGASVIIGCALGAAAGIGANLLFLRRLVRNLYGLRPSLLVALFLLYSVGIFGFFMGVPAFNVLIGLVAGWYAGRRARVAAHAGGLGPALRRAELLSTATLAAFCCAAAWLALRDGSTAANLQGMLGLGFPVTQRMIWAIILVGGPALLALQAFGVRFAAKLAYAH